MSALSLSLLCLVMQAGGGLEDRALDSQDFYEAWRLISAEPDELTAMCGKARILYRAGDPAGSFAAARAGLNLDANQPVLLYYAAGSAIWLENGADAVSYSERLRVASEAVRDSESRQEWLNTATSFSDASRALVEREARLDRSLARLKLISAAGLAAWIVVLRLLLGQGKSSRPVS